MNRARFQAGFTLIELLVAVSITVVLAGIMLVVTSSSLNVWERAQSGMEMNAQVKVAFDMIQRDLQAAIYRDQGETLFACNVSSSGDLKDHGWRLQSSYDPLVKPTDGAGSLHALGNTINPPDQRINEARFGQSGLWLRFLTSNVESGGSLPVVISYQVNRRPVSGTMIDGATNIDVRYTLFRSKVNAEDTFKFGYNVTSDNYKSAFEQPQLFDALCNNVVDFGLWAYQRESDGALTRIYPESDGDKEHLGMGQFGAAQGQRFPDVVDVMLRVLTENGAAALAQIEQGHVTRPNDAYGTDADWWWAVVERESHVYVQRIIINGARP